VKLTYLLIVTRYSILNSDLRSLIEEQQRNEAHTDEDDIVRTSHGKGKGRAIHQSSKSESESPSSYREKSERKSFNIEYPGFRNS
jgi:hypothetical protein